MLISLGYSLYICLPRFLTKPTVTAPPEEIIIAIQRMLFFLGNCFPSHSWGWALGRSAGTRVCLRRGQKTITMFLLLLGMVCKKVCIGIHGRWWSRGATYPRVARRASGKVAELREVTILVIFIIVCFKAVIVAVCTSWKGSKTRK